MLRSVFVDFYGTLVHEDGEVIKVITDKIFESGNAEKQSDISYYWWNDFQGLFKKSKGDTFRTQRELELISLKNTISHFNSNLDCIELSKLMFKYWQKPPVFEDTKLFFELCPVPIIILSNIDNCDIKKAILYNNLNPSGVVTSEEAKSYKPQKEIFEYALKKYKLTSDMVLHIGDSLTSDILGAKAAGISSVWVNRFNKHVPDFTETVVSNFKELIEFLNIY